MQTKIYELQAEINNEKLFNTSHLQEVIKLKREISHRDKTHISSGKDDQNRLQSRLAQLEIECAELKEYQISSKTNLEYLKNLVSSQTQTIKQLEEQLSTARDEINDPKLKNLNKRFEELHEQELNLGRVIEKLDHAMSAFEGDMSCMSCLNLLDEAVLTIPCGHILCNNCSMK